MRSDTHYYAQGSIIADSRDDSRGLIVITSGQVLHFGTNVLSHLISHRLNCWCHAGQVGAELPVDSDDATAENQSENGNTLLFVFERGYGIFFLSALFLHFLFSH